MESKDKRAQKKGGSKHEPKRAASVVQGAAVDTMPENLGFLFRIDSVFPDYEHTPIDMLNVGPLKGNNITKYWFPPTHAKQFHRTRGDVYRWRMGESKVFQDFDLPKDKYDIASMFFQARQDNFVVTRLDCDRHNVEGKTHGWGHVQFHHLGYNVSEVDFAGDKFTLAAPAGGGCTWMPEVLPAVYDYDTRDPYKKHSHGMCGGLCGKLAILIGMAALSAPEASAEAVVSECFGLGTWKGHGGKVGIGRYQDRGVIVSIYLDPAAEGVTKEHLEAFERGKYGPIWDCAKMPQTAYRTDTSARSIPRSTAAYSLGSYNLTTSPLYEAPVGTIAFSGPARNIDDEDPEADV